VIAYLIRRLSWGFAVLLTVAVMTFLLAYVAPGDPARAIVGRNATAEAAEAVRVALGLDRPLPEQMADYLLGVVSLDFGTSYQLNRPVLDVILDRLPATVELALAGVIVAVLIGIPLGVRSASKPGGRTDRTGILGTSVLVAAPAFLVGYVFIYLFAFQPAVLWGISVFPIGGYEPWDLRYLILPAITLGIGLAAYYARLTRTTVLDELHQDYARTARAKGVAERRVVWRHVFRNALPPLLIQVGLDLGVLLGGVVIVESVFSWNGIGKLAIDAVTQEDLPMLLGTVLFATLCIVIANLVIDILIAFVDPRVRIGGLAR
jgi:peptide/nickel transport system permease protein